MASNEIIPKWHCEIAGWEKLPLVRQLILFPHLSLICWSHTLSRRTAAAVYICLRCAGWWQGVKSAVRELSDVPVCAPIKSTWDSPCFSPPLVSMGRRMVKGGELKEPTRRQRPLTDLTSVIRVLQCQHANQIKMNGAYPGHWRLASLGPISSVPVTVHIERLIERLTMPLCEEETQTHTNRFPVNGRGELLQGCETERTGGSRGTPPPLMPNWYGSAVTSSFVRLYCFNRATPCLGATVCFSDLSFILSVFVQWLFVGRRALYERHIWLTARVY